MGKSRAKRAITRADILSPEAFLEVRRERRAALVAAKRLRRVEVGPFATFLFESYDTMWWQIHEMLRIEKGGEAQIADELAAYGPLVPKGDELVATLMFEIEDPVRRERILSSLGGVEETVTLAVGDDTINAVPERDVVRTDPTGKTSSVHFLHFPFTAAQIAAFRDPAQRVVLAIDHEGYSHLAVLPEAVRRTLSEDFD